MRRRLHQAYLTLVVVVLSACDPPYISDNYATSTPKLSSAHVEELVRAPVVVLGFMSPPGLQGFSPTLSHALSKALAEVVPPIREIPVNETLNRLTDNRLGAEYGELRAGFARSGMLDRQLLRRLGLPLGSRYVMLPGLAQFDEAIIDKVEAVGIKLVRNRVTTLRLWLQMWDCETGHIVWESAGEATTATVFLSPKQTVALEQIATRLLVRMVQDGMLGSRTEREPSSNS